MPRTNHLPFQKTLLAIAMGAALSPAWALELVQEPPLPTSKSAFVAPNVIISVDDSGSMEYCLTNSEAHESNSSMNTVPKRQENCWVGVDKNGKDIIKKITNEKAPVNGVWPDTSRRINVLKYSLKNVFSDPKLIEENKIRLAWQAMNSNSAGSLKSNSIETNSMRPIDQKINSQTHRENFLNFIQNFSASGSTPSHKMFSQADAYMRAKTNKNGPWSTDPGGSGSKADEFLGCRRNYHIMMTDGRWNGAATALPDATKRDNATDLPIGGGVATYTGSDSVLYRDKSSGTTLADWAFYSWATPLQSSSSLKDSDKLTPSLVYKEAPATETFGTGSNSVTLKKFWNPKYNPATWPHMVTYTIGFSESAYTWNYNSITKPTEIAPFIYDGSFPALAKGTTTWPDLTKDTEDKNALDLWHAALNGRGRFYAIEQGSELENAFREIIGKINEESAPLPDEIAGGGSTSGYNVSQSNAGIFASIYSPKRGWSGSITASRAIEPEEYACPTKDDPNLKCIRFPDTIAGWEGKSTAERLDALTQANIDNRLVLSWSDDTSQGIPFKWTATDEISYSTAQKKHLLGLQPADTITAALKTQGQNIVNYIRGDRTLEGTTEAKPLRERFSRQGDVVNSEIWYTGRPSGSYAMGYASFVAAQKARTPVLYVGGNDGMLHGFSATDGKELIAYVPRGVVGGDVRDGKPSGLKDLTDKDYQHRYYVDGSPMTGDIKDGSTWKTMLVGSLGAGGKGYFVLDVTNPAGFGSATAANLVVLDRTRAKGEAAPNCTLLTGTAKTACEKAVAEINDIGNIVAQPGRNPANLQEATQITRLNNGRWAVVMGNGYNSTNERPVLLLQYLDGDKALVRIQATTDTTDSGNANDNGLASPTLVDLDGDGKTDVVYAGDNLGNLWKFDLTSATESNWKVAFGNNKPLFTTLGPVALTSTTRNQVQPITAPPIVRANDRMMTVGTGANAKTIPVGGMMVAFGTGRNVTANDRRTDITQNVQSLYSVMDNTRYRMKSDNTSLEVHPGAGDCDSAPVTCVPTPTPVGPMGADGRPLAQQTIATVVGDFATVNATQALQQATWKDYKGWFIDLPFKGERLIKPMQFFDGSNILAIYTESPSGTKNSESDNINESCVPVKVDTSAGSQFRTLVNIMDGKLPSVQLVDINNDGIYNAADNNVARAAVKTGTPLLITKRGVIWDGTGGGLGAGKNDNLNRMPEQSMRPSWRQLR